MLQSEVSYDTLIKLKVTDSIIQRYLLSINDFTLEESLQSYIGNISITFSKRSYIFQWMHSLQMTFIVQTRLHISFKRYRIKIILWFAFSKYCTCTWFKNNHKTLISSLSLQDFSETISFALFKQGTSPKLYNLNIIIVGTHKLCIRLSINKIVPPLISSQTSVYKKTEKIAFVIARLRTKIIVWCVQLTIITVARNHFRQQNQ